MPNQARFLDLSGLLALSLNIIDIFIMSNTLYKISNIVLNMLGIMFRELLAGRISSDSDNPEIPVVGGAKVNS